MSDSEYYKQGGDGYSMGELASQDSRVYNIIAELEPLAANSKVLDIGCGDMFLSRLVPKLSWTGIDLCERPGVIVHDLTVTPYPIQKASQDAVVCSEVLEHLFDPVKVINEAQRVLKTSGKILVTVPNFDSLDFHLQSHREQVFDPTKSHSVEHIRQYTPQSMGKLLEQAGFDIEGVIGNSPHMCKWLRHGRAVMQLALPKASTMEVDRLLGQMFPDLCMGFMIIAKKK